MQSSDLLKEGKQFAGDSTFIAVTTSFPQKTED